MTGGQVISLLVKPFAGKPAPTDSCRAQIIVVDADIFERRSGLIAAFGSTYMGSAYCLGT
jgi:hypothetical protein